MRVFALILGMLVSSHGFADDMSVLMHGFKARGAGSWTSVDGETTRYKVSVHGVKTENGLQINETYHLGGDKKKEMSFDLVPAGESFYDVMIGGEDVGDAYCYHRRIKSKVCHLEFELMGRHIERTIEKVGLHIYRMGSVTFAGDENHEGYKFKHHDKLHLYH